MSESTHWHSLLVIEQVPAELLIRWMLRNWDHFQQERCRWQNPQKRFKDAWKTHCCLAMSQIHRLLSGTKYFALSVAISNKVVNGTAVAVYSMYKKLRWWLRTIEELGVSRQRLLVQANLGDYDITIKISIVKFPGFVLHSCHLYSICFSCPTPRRMSEGCGQRMQESISSHCRLTVSNHTLDICWWHLTALSKLCLWFVLFEIHLL